VIKYLNLKGLSRNEIADDIKVVMGDDAPSYATICQWIAKFKRGRESTEDAHRSGRPAEACMEENVQRVNDMLMTDRHLTVRYVAERLKLSYGTTHHIVPDILGYNKVCTRWVPRMLTPENKQARLTTSRSAVAMATIRECGFQLLYHPPCSPDLTPSDYRVFPSLKDSLRGQIFDGCEEVICAVNGWFEHQNKNFLNDGVKSLTHPWEKCILLEGDYIEKL